MGALETPQANAARTRAEQRRVRLEQVEHELADAGERYDAALASADFTTVDEAREQLRQLGAERRRLRYPRSRR